MVLGEVEQMLTSNILVEMTPPAMMTDLLEAIGIVSAENGESGVSGASGAANPTEKRSVASGGDHAHGRGDDAPDHVSVKGHLGEVGKRVPAGAGNERGREVEVVEVEVVVVVEETQTPSHVKEAESVTGTENAKEGAGAGRGGGTGSEGRVRREVKRAQAV